MENDPPVDLTLRLGPPEQIQLVPPQAQNPVLAPHEGELYNFFFYQSQVETINSRLLLYAERKAEWQRPLDKIRTLINLKGQVFSKMAQLDPHPLWVLERNRLIADSILTKNNREYSVSRLEQRLSELNKKGIYCLLVRVRFVDLTC